MKFTLENKQLELDVSLSKSGVTFRESDDTALELVFSGLRKKTVEEVYQISFRGNRLYIKEKGRSRHSPMIDAVFNSPLASDLILMIPSGTLLTGKVASLKGDIKAERLNFRGELKTVTGRIEIEEMKSDGLNVQNIGGNIRFGRFNGYLRGKTVAGRFLVEQGKFSELVIKGVSGDIQIAGEFDLEDEGEISSLSGGIQLDINAYRGNALLLLNTLSGQVTVSGDYPEDTVLIKKRMPFIKNQPFKSVFSPMKEMFSSFFKNSGEEVEVEVDSPGTDENHVKMILEMLSQGKISAEEAEKLIRALEKRG
jgi:DUF4097 and DUF4098 domain-containing protein YvlB